MAQIGYSYTTDNEELPVKDDAATNPRTRGFIAVGVDALGVARFVRTDADGRIEVTGGGGGLTVTADQGTPNTVPNAWPILVTDGADTAQVKPASTAPVAADPALVVTLSPNLAVGTASNPLRVDPTGTTTQNVNVVGGSVTIAGTSTSKIADEDGNFYTSSFKNGTRSLAVESRDLVFLLAQLLDEMRLVRRQLASITDEDDPL